MSVFKSVGVWFVCVAALALPAQALSSRHTKKHTAHSQTADRHSAHRHGSTGSAAKLRPTKSRQLGSSKSRSSKGSKRKATSSSRYARSSGGKRTAKHRLSSRRAAKRDQGPVREETLEEIFPPGHRFTHEEQAEASAIGVYMENGMWKDAYKYSTKAGRQHPDRWWLHAARAAAAANVQRPKETIEAVDWALHTNRGDANRLNLSQLYVLKANALSRLNRKDEAIATFLNGAKVNPKDPYSRAGAAWLYATAEDSRIRNGAQAVALAGEAAKLSHERDATILDVLAASYAEQGDFRAAQHWEQKAILFGAAADVPFYQRRLQSYQTAKPWRERNA